MALMSMSLSISRMSLLSVQEGARSEATLTSKTSQGSPQYCLRPSNGLPQEGRVYMVPTSSTTCQCSCYLWARDTLESICCDVSEERRDITSGSENQSDSHTA